MTEVLPIEQHDPFSTGLSGRRLGRYEVLARLASGGMAAIYIARAVGVAGFERLFAIKVLHPHLAHEHEFVAMFLDEARLAARIRHPNVVSTIDISDTVDTGYYLVMEYIEGDHLGALMREAARRGERLPISNSLRIITDALSGLGAAHDLIDEAGNPLNLVHRDISPQNIMVSTDGVSRLTDFGVAKSESRLSNTRDGQFKGKLAYMAPEHASDGFADQRSDLFAMGTIFWETLTGQRLFRAENHAATLNKVCLEPIPIPSSVDPSLEIFDSIVSKALERNPEKRYQSASEFMDAIEEKATELSGLGKRREIIELVKTYAEEKLSKDRLLIKNAIASIDSEGISSNLEPFRALTPQIEGMPSAADYSQPLSNEASETRAEGRTHLPIPSVSDFERRIKPSGPSKLAWVLVSLSIAVLAGIGLAFALAGSDQLDQIKTSPLMPTTPKEPEDLLAPRAEQKQPSSSEATEKAADSPSPIPEDDKGREAPSGESDRRTSRSNSKHDTSATGQPERNTRRRSDSRPPFRAPSPTTSTVTNKSDDVHQSRSKDKPAPQPPVRRKRTLTDDIIMNPYR